MRITIAVQVNRITYNITSHDLAWQKKYRNLPSKIVSGNATLHPFAEGRALLQVLADKTGLDDDRKLQLFDAIQRAYEYNPDEESAKKHLFLALSRLTLACSSTN